MVDANAQVIDLIFGRWRSQILYAGVKLGIFDALVQEPKNAASVAVELDADAGMIYRLMRALGSLGLLQEDNTKTFSLTPTGELLTSNHPQTLRGMTLWEEGPLPYAAWRHLSDLIKEGKDEGFVREFGSPIFEYLPQHRGDGEVFNEAMSSYSGADNALVLEALENYDFSGISHICDIGGGHGYTLSNLMAKYQHLQGTVLDMPSVIANKEMLWANKLGVGDRCSYVAGDMFRAVPRADAYVLKRVLHDWNDEECVQILSNAHKAAPSNARVLIIEAVVPGPETPHFSKLFDIHMLVMLTGRERTTEEFAELLEHSGWKYRHTCYPASRILGIIEGVKA
jgi:hypothetical protein